MNGAVMKCFIMVFLLLFSCISSADENLKSQILQYMEFGKIPSLVIVTVDKNKKSNVILLTNENKNSTQNLDKETIFELASVSKSFTGLIAAKMIEEGKILPQTKVSSILPSIKTNYDGENVDVTFLQLLNHTSGLPFKTIDMLYSRPQKGLSQVIDDIKLINLQTMPGQQYAYATLNYDIAARMMEKVSGQSYQQLLQTYILAPLQMNATSTLPDVAKKAIGHQISFLQARPYDAPFVLANVPAGYIQTNASDMLNWLRFLASNTDSTLFSAKKLVFSGKFGVDTNESEKAIYTLGWYKQGNRVFHTGMNPTFSSYVAVDLDSGTAVAVMANVNSNITFELGKQIMQQLAQGGDFTGLNTVKDLELFDTFDSTFLVVSVFVILACLFLIYLNLKGKNISWLANFGVVKTTILSALFIIALLVVLTFPNLLLGLSWATFMIWMPNSFWVLYCSLVLLLLLCLSLFSQVLYRRRSAH
ncbi:penicillin-binding protein, beta-lactamase class C [Photorhabdus aegyptia]|uniref:Penicillin-binding protein, beta-lactamase class C n=2 Tax=Photorhabdus aegyptia TaxID=2805098 RepID=A0A022PIR6_9GAMM|nr:penicillin-binding protein, beta-lactamase class C [Photorhabdus aegyptia]